MSASIGEAGLVAPQRFSHADRARITPQARRLKTFSSAKHKSCLLSLAAQTQASALPATARACMVSNFYSFFFTNSAHAANHTTTRCWRFDIPNRDPMVTIAYPNHARGVRDNVVAITIRDVARRAHVSVATVSRALAEPQLLREQTRKRVLAAAEQLAYRPNPAARSLITGRTGNIGIIVPDLANPFDPG